MTNAHDNRKFEVAEYLYESNRNAIAHVNLKSGRAVINPDDIEHHHRISNSVQLIKDLAKHAISQKKF